MQPQSDPSPRYLVRSIAPAEPSPHARDVPSLLHATDATHPADMGQFLYTIFLTACIKLASLSNQECVIELHCAECVPEHMPVVTSHRAAAAEGAIRVAHGDGVVLACAPGAFLAYPRIGIVAARCDRGLFRLPPDVDLQPRRLMELGCQESLFEDALHHVENCGPPLQGRAYSARSQDVRRHLATVCFDPDRAVALRARASSSPRGVALPPHSDTAAPLSLLGNFNELFDSRTRHEGELLYSDEARLAVRLRHALAPDRIAFADQTLATAELLAATYFEGQDSHVTEFASNKVAVWRSVASGNLRHLQRDVAELARAARVAEGAGEPLEVHAGTHGVASTQTGAGREELWLKPSRRFPVPRYVWTVVSHGGRALALAVLNDPFVTLSAVDDATPCASQCERVPWLHELRRGRNYEVPLYGLVFCCALHDFTARVTELPPDIIQNIPVGSDGMLFSL